MKCKIVLLYIKQRKVISVIAVEHAIGELGESAHQCEFCSNNPGVLCRPTFSEGQGLRMVNRTWHMHTRLLSASVGTVIHVSEV